MMNSISHLSDCVSPVSAARIYNPINPDYYRKDAAPTQATEAASSDAVRITLSAEAQAALKN